jgi:hypothetical protein
MLLGWVVRTSKEAGNVGMVVGFMLVGLWRFKYE